MGIEQVCTAPRAPWQNPYVERLIGSVRRECLDHLIILDEGHLHRILRTYLSYYHESLTHLSLNKDAPEGRMPESAELGKIITLPVIVVFITDTPEMQHNALMLSLDAKDEFS